MYTFKKIAGDGRCLFRSLVYGVCLRSSKSAPSESLQAELADDLRAKVADEFVKRREESQWFIEGDFDAYVSEIRKWYKWGGEPELLMASHVLQMPIAVYMKDDGYGDGGLKRIVEYGQEYGNENPIMVVYNGCGHYDALTTQEEEEEEKKELEAVKEVKEQGHELSKSNQTVPRKPRNNKGKGRTQSQRVDDQYYDHGLNLTSRKNKKNRLL